MARRDTRDRGRDRGREERGLASRRRRRQECLEILGEAHVEHLVGLVEDDHLHRVEREAAARQVVDGASGCRDHDVHAPPERAQLLADRLAAVDREDVGVQAATVAVDGLGDLHRQLACRDEDEGQRPALAGSPQAARGGESLQDRERERGRLAGPGRRLGEHVATRRGAAGSSRAGRASAPRSRGPRGSRAAPRRGRATAKLPASSSGAARAGSAETVVSVISTAYATRTNGDAAGEPAASPSRQGRRVSALVRGPGRGCDSAAVRDRPAPTASHGHRDMPGTAMPGPKPEPAAKARTTVAENVPSVFRVPSAITIAPTATSESVAGSSRRPPGRWSRQSTVDRQRGAVTRRDGDRRRGGSR